jgi:hypothetical protein
MNEHTTRRRNQRLGVGGGFDPESRLRSIYGDGKGERELYFGVPAATRYPVRRGYSTYTMSRAPRTIIIAGHSLRKNGCHLLRVSDRPLVRAMANPVME